MTLNFMGEKRFAFVQQHPLQSQFRGVQGIVDYLGLPIESLQYRLVDPKDLFDQLIKSTLEIDLIQVLALMGWEGGDWKTPYGQYAMKNWWHSVLQQDHNKTGSYLTSVMILRSVLADTEKYPAPKDVVLVMRQVLQQLITESKLKHIAHVDVLDALLQEDAKKLAQIALKKQLIVTDLIQQSRLPQKLPTVQQAGFEWLELWIGVPQNQRKKLRLPLQQMLHQRLTIEQQAHYARIIFHHQAFSNQIDYLRLEVKHYPELVAWLSACARQSEFKALLTTQERQWLNCWIGTGNYESLREILMDIAKSTNDPQDEKRTDSRYIFWHSYQALFQEAWLFLPQTYFQKNKSNLTNIKEIQGTEHATIVLKLKGYYIFQYFLGTASQINLLVTKDVKWVERILNQKMISNDDLLQLNLLLIHDHEYKWQSDLAFTLEKHFKIQPEQQRIRYPLENGSYGFSSYQKDVKNPEHERKRKQVVSRWLHNNVKNQFVPEVYHKAALTAKRYGLLD
jgi:hypothetical protein